MIRPMSERLNSKPSISCVMPAFNEARNLESFVPQVLQMLR